MLEIITTGRDCGLAEWINNYRPCESIARLLYDMILCDQNPQSSLYNYVFQNIISSQPQTFNQHGYQNGQGVLIPGQVPTSDTNQQVIVNGQQVKTKCYKTGTINDSLSQTLSPVSSRHYIHLKIVLSCEIFKMGT